MFLKKIKDLQKNIRERTKDNIIYRYLVFFESLFKKIIANKKIFFVFLLISIIFFILIKFILSEYFKKIFWTFFLISLAVFSLFPQRFKFLSFIGFELCMMAVVLTTLAYGRKYGVFVAFASLIGGYVLSENFKPSSFISIFTLPLISLIVPFFDLPMFYLGIIMTIIYDIIILPLYILMGSNIYKSIVFFITHLIFNAWVFYFVAPIIYNIMIL